jgi:3-hydroxyisobutyrate dehydrogenase
MTAKDLRRHRLGWIGTGRMGHEMAARLARAGADLLVYNRTRAKAAPLAKDGARIAERPSDLADRDLVFAMLATSDDLKEVLAGPAGLLGADQAPRVLVDCSSISLDASAELRRILRDRGVDLLAAPVSGNPKVVRAGKLAIVASGPQKAFEEARPYLEAIGAGASYVGDGELARIVKICHNVFLGVVTQSLAEITVLAQKAGVSRAAFLDFIGKSVLGSLFTRYKSPAFVNLDFAVTFTPQLLRKDLDLGLAAGRQFEVPMPLASVTRDLVQALIGNGLGDGDFAKLLVLQARASGLELHPEDVAVSDGLS